MARPHTPTSVLDARGSFIVHPEREKAREQEPTTDKPLGDPPARLGAEMQAVWQEVAAELLPGVGKRSDRQMFEVLIRLITKLRKGTIRMTEMNGLISLCGQFAMTPASRSKVSASAEPSTALTRFLNRASKEVN